MYTVSGATRLCIYIARVGFGREPCRLAFPNPVHICMLNISPFFCPSSPLQCAFPGHVLGRSTRLLLDTVPANPGRYQRCLRLGMPGTDAVRYCLDALS